jgi:hypothetical protein
VISSTVQTVESNVDEYIRKISDKQANVDACVRLMDAECMSFLWYCHQMTDAYSQFTRI